MQIRTKGNHLESSGDISVMIAEKAIVHDALQTICVGHFIPLQHASLAIGEGVHLFPIYDRFCVETIGTGVYLMPHRDKQIRHLGFRDR